ncbi:phytoene desaturase [Skermania sp. ID1734]|uniref:phytoene desaturase family protein n=1 Tax=Skermania sp. ID1734 TaxID=2597516 RepID=UPI00117E0DF6|nr:phytoene desaturase family protein [Skermania sp. ID1734]TSE01206.1 phytoene desaturase [Skermania sp. ID1734]
MVRTVPAPSQRVVVIGAGLAGLSAALHLRGSGREVTVLERADHAGGRVGRYTGADYVIDNGATVLTMPELITEALAAIGASTDLRIRRLDPSYHARFADGSTINVHSDADAMFAEVSRTCGPAEAQRYLQLRRWLAAVFTAEYDTFMAANFDSPLNLVSSRRSFTDLMTLVRLGAFGRLGPKVGRFIGDERLRRLFTFQALYAGLAPQQALAVYGAIPHMDTSLGVFFPDGGMASIAEAMADALTTAGGRVELGAEVTRIHFEGRRATAVHTRDCREFPCDAVVLTADLGSLPGLIGDKAPRRKLHAAPSAVVLHGTVPTAVSQQWPTGAHHVIEFGKAWADTFAEITARNGCGRLMSDPSLLLTRPALTDPALVIRRGTETYEPFSVLAPCPNLRSAPLDWDRLAPAYAEDLLVQLERRGYTAIAESFQVDWIDTPATWRRQGMLAGSPFSASHLFRQTGPFRTANLLRRTENVVLAGCGTTPGVGVPTVLISGKLAAARIMGG